MGWILAALLLYITAGNFAIVVGWYTRHNTGSVVPCIGALSIEPGVRSSAESSPSILERQRIKNELKKSSFQW